MWDEEKGGMEGEEGWRERREAKMTEGEGTAHRKGSTDDGNRVWSSEGRGHALVCVTC